jgi:anti-sigma B factor antagonist
MTDAPLFRLVEKDLGEEARLLAVRGEIDIAVAPEFRESVASATDDSVRKVVVDLSEVQFMDSSGLQVLLNLRKDLTARGGELVLACDSAPVLDLFRLTGLDKVCEIVPSVDDVLVDGVT